MLRPSAPALALTLALGCDAPPSHPPPPDPPPIRAAPESGPGAPAPPSVAWAPATTAPAEAPSPETVPTETAPPQPAPGPATVEQIEVPGHLPVSIARSRSGAPPRIVFFPGICSNAYAYLVGFPEAARAHGGAIAIDGDRPCGATPGFRSITSDPTHEEPRIDAALRAAGVESPETADIVFVGYSLGATLIENLVRKSPERYRRVVLIGSPRDPRLDRLKGARAVATMSCSLDVPGRMKGATRMLENAGVASRYFEMPGCTHGNLADAERVMGEAFEWLTVGAAAHP